MNKQSVLTTVASISIFYLVFTTGFYATYYNDDYIKSELKDNGAYNRLDEAYANQVHNGLMKYFNEKPFQYKRLHLISEFTKSEQSHMKDVKIIVDWVKVIYYLAIMVFLAMVFAMWKYFDIELVHKPLIYGSYAVVGLILLIALSSFLSFESSWTAMHKIFFPGGNWAFPYGSLTMNLYPPEFFENITFRVLITNSIIAALGLTVGSLLKRKFN